MLLEVVPVVLGIALGTVAGPGPGRRGILAGLGASLALGVLVAWASGELARSVGYAIFDTAVIACTGLLLVAAQRAVRVARRAGAPQP